MTDIVERIDTLTRRTRVFVAGGAGKPAAPVLPDEDIPVLTEVVDERPVLSTDGGALREELAATYTRAIRARIDAELPALLATLAAKFGSEIEIAVGRLLDQTFAAYAEGSVVATDGEANPSDGSG